MGIRNLFSRPALTGSTALAGATFRGLGAAARAEDDDDTDMRNKPAEGEGEESKDKGKNKGKTKTKTKTKNKEGEGEGEGEDENEDGEGEGDGADDDDDDGDDDTDEADMRRGRKNAVVRNARMRERKRIAHIMESGAGASNYLAALSVALNTDMGREKAAAFLETMPPLTAAHAEAPEPTLESRMEQLDGRNAGRDAAPSVRGKGQIDKVWAEAIDKHAITAKKPA